MGPKVKRVDEAIAKNLTLSEGQIPSWPRLVPVFATFHSQFWRITVECTGKARPSDKKPPQTTAGSHHFPKAGALQGSSSANPGVPALAPTEMQLVQQPGKEQCTQLRFPELQMACSPFILGFSRCPPVSYVSILFHQTYARERNTVYNEAASSSPLLFWR